MPESMPTGQSEFIARIEQQIETGNQLHEGDITPFAKWIEKAEEWSDNTIEGVGLFKPFYRDVDWKEIKIECGQNDNATSVRQKYQNLLLSSINSLVTLPDIPTTQCGVVARIEQQIESGRAVRLYTLPINFDDSYSAKHPLVNITPEWLNIDFITEAEKWSNDTLKCAGVFKPCYRAIDWQEFKAILNEYAMPNKNWQYYKDLLRSSVKSLEVFRDRLKGLFL